MTKIAGSGPDLNPDPDPLVKGMDPRIRIRIWIHTKMSWNRNIGKKGVEIWAFDGTQMLPSSKVYFYSAWTVPLKE
jgi:hypothetical protein